MTSKKMSLDCVLSVTCDCVEFVNLDQFQEGKIDKAFYSQILQTPYKKLQDDMNQTL